MIADKTTTTINGVGLGCSVGSWVFAGLIIATGGAIAPVLAVGAALSAPVIGGLIGNAIGDEED